MVLRSFLFELVSLVSRSVFDFDNWPIFPYSRLGQSPKVNSGELLWQDFYVLDAIHVTQPATSKH